MKEPIVNRPSSLERLPEAIRKQLLMRQADRPGLSLNDQVAWLAEEGYKVSRSALYRYLAKEKASDAIPDTTSQATADRSVRLGCLMVAASYALPGDKIDLIKTADEFVEWVGQPDPS